MLSALRPIFWISRVQLAFSELLAYTVANSQVNLSSSR
ncbi:hypothetical protein SPLC1_S080940 [Arthrospira platensis C1]|nr:hypothetical protein SPLC1_S080940 [Arthrospira platensis C1]